MKTATFAVLGSLMMLGVLVVPRARANEWNKEMTLTFNHPVEIPGRVLEPGTYQFKVADVANDRDVIDIYNAAGTHLVETAFSTPEYRSKATSQVVVTFEERAADSPKAVKAWFYPGEKWGQEFLYQAAGKKKS